MTLRQEAAPSGGSSRPDSNKKSRRRPFHSSRRPFKASGTGSRASGLRRGAILDSVQVVAYAVQLWCHRGKTVTVVQPVQPSDQ